MIDAVVIDALVASGCTPEQIAAAVKASMAAENAAVEAKREKDRLRKAAERAAAKARTVASGPMTSCDVHGNPRTDKESTDNAETVSLSPIPLLPPTPPNNPLTPKPIQKNNSRGTRLPDDWQLTGPDLAYALSKGLTERETGDLAERFKSWALSASGPNAVKRNWHQAFQGWVQRDGPKIIASRSSAFGKPMSFSQHKQMETQNVLAALRTPNRDCQSSGGSVDRFLSLDPGQQPADLRGGTSSDVRLLPGISDRGSH